MTAAEALRGEMEQVAPFTKKEFIEVVTDAIRRNGVYQYTLNGRTDSSSLKGGTIPTKYHELVKKWATEEGFTVTRYCNYFGVPEYDITL